MTKIGTVMMTNKKGQKNDYSDNNNSDRKDEGMDDNANHKIDNDDKEHDEDNKRSLFLPKYKCFELSFRNLSSLLQKKGCGNLGASSLLVKTP